MLSQNPNFHISFKSPKRGPHNSDHGVPFAQKRCSGSRGRSISGARVFDEMRSDVAGDRDARQGVHLDVASDRYALRTERLA